LEKILHEVQNLQEMDYHSDRLLCDLLRRKPDMVADLVKKQFPGVKKAWVPPEEYKTDKDLYEDMKKWYDENRPNDAPDAATILVYRSKARVRQLRDIFRVLNFTYQKRSYFDFGAADGTISKNLAQYLGFRKPIYMTDVESWHTNERREEDSKDAKFKFLDSGGQIPFAGKKWDILTSLMVLHHVPDQEAALKDLQKHMFSKTSILVVREHDATDPDIKDMCHVEHAIHSVVMEGQTLEEFRKEYRGLYRSKLEWQELFQANGFTCTFADVPSGPTRYFYMTFQV
jgi:2-polyprenyl-3-methyl-5-hydroxy-6-metoxy-1,4-benzoquinol methylase